MSKHYLQVLLITVLLFSCNSSEEKQTKIEQTSAVEIVDVPKLDINEANRLAQLPIECIFVEYPNKLSQTLGDETDLQNPKQLHPAFYGCFDWHSSVHGHWSLVTLIKQFPDIKHRDSIKSMLRANMTKENIEAEVRYFGGKHNKSFERTYGWAWLLQLAQVLHEWDDPFAKEMESNLQPLTDLLVDKYIEFLPKLNYPIRVGTHSNTAFGLSFALDYANVVENKELSDLIKQRARDFYFKDIDCPLSWEPSGYDFLSPCLEEAALMKRVLTLEEFKLWMDKFLPQLKDPSFNLEVGEVSDREDGHLVHLDGVNFSRAWCLNTIANGLPEYEHLHNIANAHINYSLPSIVDGNYEGTHWLGSFAIYALNTVE